MYAGRRVLAIAAAVPLALQAIVLEILLLSGVLYRQPIDTYSPPPTTSVGSQDGLVVSVSFTQVYADYGFFGPYFEIDIVATLLVLAGLVVAALAVLTIELRARGVFGRVRVSVGRVVG